MTYEEAAKIAKEIAKLEPWEEEHIADPHKYWDGTWKHRCNCSLCYWRRAHIEKILREDRDDIRKDISGAKVSSTTIK